MQTKSVATRIPLDVIEKIEAFAERQKTTVSSVLSEMVCEHFNLTFTPDEFAIFTKVSKSLILMASSHQKTNAYYAAIGQELLNNLIVNPDGSYKTTKSGMYYFNDTETLRDLITEYLEDTSDE